MVEEIMVKFYYELWKEARIVRKGVTEYYDWLPEIIQCGVAKVCFLKLYQVGHSYNSFLKIEDLPEKEKRDLIKKARSTGLNFTNKTLVEACKIIYYLNMIDGK